MSELTLRVGGRPFTISCADGEEERVQHLAGIVDQKLASLGVNRVPGDAKNMLFAALILADELDDAKRAPPPPALQIERANANTMGMDRLAGRLESMAERLEWLAQSLER